MQKVLKNIVNLSVAVILVLATGGFTVFQHYCSCEEVVITSVLKETVCLHDSNEPESCCQDDTAVNDCCLAKTKDPAQSPKRDHNHDCCQDRVSYFKTADGYTPGKQEVKPFSLSVTFFNPAVKVNNEIPVTDSPALSESSSLFSIPREFLIAHQRKDSPEIA